MRRSLVTLVGSMLVAMATLVGEVVVRMVEPMVVMVSMEAMGQVNASFILVEINY